MDWLLFLLQIATLAGLVWNGRMLKALLEKQRVTQTTLSTVMKSLGSYQTRMRATKRSDAIPRREHPKEDQAVHRDAPTGRTARMSRVKRGRDSIPASDASSGGLRQDAQHYPLDDGGMAGLGDSPSQS